MFLVERVVGISIYSFFLFLFAFLIYRAKDLKKVKQYLIIYTLILGIMGYFYVQYYTADLDYIKNVTITNYSLKSFTEMIPEVKKLGIHPIYYWIFGKIGNVNLIPAVTAIIFYTNLFYIIYDSAKKFEFTPKTISKLILFSSACGAYLEVISGIKSLMAFSIIAFCIYKEFFRNKTVIGHLPLYLFAALFHDAAFVIVALRFIYLLFEPKRSRFEAIFNIAPIFLAIVVVFLFFSNTLISVVNHSMWYIIRNVYSNVWEYIIAGLSLAFTIYSTWLFFKFDKYKSDVSLQKCFRFVVFLIICDLIFCFEYSIFHRFSIFIGIACLPIIGMLFHNSRNEEYAFLEKYNEIFTIYFVFTYGLALVRGNLSNLKFFKL